ncbi:unnamed protein product [Closterium sp. NIES-54]
MSTAHIPLNQHPDVVRWLPALSPLQADRPLALAAWDYRTCSAHLHALLLSPPQSSASPPAASPPPPTLAPLGAWRLPARASRLSVCALPDGRSLLLLGSRGGHVSALLLDGWDVLGAEGALAEALQQGETGEGRGGDERMEGVDGGNGAGKARAGSDEGKRRAGTGLLVGGGGDGMGGKGEKAGGDRGIALITAAPRGAGGQGGQGHEGRVTAVDFRADNARCLSAGADGRLQAMALVAGQWVADSLLADAGGAQMGGAGAVAVTAGRWRAAAEAVTGSMGGAVQLWDVRAGPAHAPAATCSIAWSQAAPCAVGAINDIAIHPSRNHLALVWPSTAVVRAAVVRAAVVRAAVVTGNTFSWPDDLSHLMHASCTQRPGHTVYLSTCTHAQTTRARPTRLPSTPPRASRSLHCLVSSPQTTTHPPTLFPLPLSSRMPRYQAAGSQGAVVAWDLRHLHHPLMLFGSSAALPASPSPGAHGAEWAQGDVWEVQFDPLTHLSLLSSTRPAAATTAGAAAVPPMLACCDDGLFSLLHAGGAVQDIMHAPHAINSFDVEPSFGQHVVASAYHAISYVCRPKLP